jgi:hypothetical protein
VSGGKDLLDIRQLCAECLLAIQRVAGEHASLPVNLSKGLWRHGQFGFVLARIDHELSQHASEVVAGGRHGVDGMRRRRAVAQTATLSFAIERHTLPATLAHLARHARVEHPLDSRSHIGGV